MLIGCFEHNMDSKGRIIIPAKWRLDLGARIIVTCGFARKGDYQCLMGMSEERWNAFVNAVQNVSLADIVVQKALRKLFALACECELDKQGRILIAPSLRERAQLDGDIMLAGANNRIEIWNRAKWNEEMDDESGFDDETLLALSVSSATDPVAKELIDHAGDLRGCDAFFSVIISETDEKLYRTLGINVCCEPKYEKRRFFHK